ncbi:SdiA-regulated domain-containing protein [Arcobacter vandammei]|uniref:SdiA-regulated domain-containing protein n=1 Tax=Arcobacter vandammei TaxID=2782243 RepID=UPI001D194D0E|nr:SdiA-regulated domain-containing protein [Arcobacter vandammei]
MKKVSFLVILTTIFVFIHYIDLDDKLLYKVFSSKNNYLVSEENHHYELKYIKYIKKNLSGITYNEKSDTLFVITNSPRDIYELDKNGSILRKIDLKGFKDTEDLTYIKDDMFAILDEKLSSFFVVKIDEDTEIISKKDSIKEFNIDVRNFKNFGLEGISYDKIEDKFYLVNERGPKKIITVKGFMEDIDMEVNYKDELKDNNLYLGDFSAIHFDDKSKNIYILSDESALLARVDNNEKFSKYLDLQEDDLSSKLKAAEGFTKDSDGNFYIVSEPNIFLSIKKMKD